MAGNGPATQVVGRSLTAAQQFAARAEGALAVGIPFPMT